VVFCGRKKRSSCSAFLQVVVPWHTAPQFVNPLLLDADGNAIVPAKDLTPLKKRKAKGPQIVRKKLHWVPIKVGRADRRRTKRRKWHSTPSSHSTLLFAGSPPPQGKIEGTIWAGPPADLIAAAAQLITDEKEFERLFIQVR
jgi:hypothetical protein